MLKQISNIGKTLSKTAQKSIQGGIWDSLAECQANCGGGYCWQGLGVNRWACGS